MSTNLEETKQRRNITIKPSLWKSLKQLGRIQGKSASSLIEESIKLYLKEENINEAYLKMMSVSEVSDQENEEITKVLDALKPENLEEGEEWDV